MTPAELILEIHKAFKDVKKGNGIGVREAIAIDDYTEEEERLKARAKDTEDWWNIPQEWKNDLGTALSFTDVQGFRFLLPALMTASIENNDLAQSVYFHLILIKPGQGQRPHHGHKEYTDYLRSISPRKTAQYYKFNQAQIHAISLYLDWWMNTEKIYLPQSRGWWLKAIKKSHAATVKNVSSKDYNLTLEDEIANYDEECRILKDWLELGGQPKQ